MYIKTCPYAVNTQKSSFILLFDSSYTSYTYIIRKFTFIFKLILLGHIRAYENIQSDRICLLGI